MDIFEGHERTCTSKADMTEVYSHAMPCFFCPKAYRVRTGDGYVYKLSELIFWGDRRRWKVRKCSEYIEKKNVFN